MDGHWSQIVGLVWVWDDTQSSTTKSQALKEAYVAHSYKRVTILLPNFLPSPIWMDVPNSHLLSGSLRGWLLATGEGRQKSAAKSSSVSKWQGIWTCCLKTEVSSAAHNGTPGGRSRLTDLDKVGSCSCLTAGLRCTRVCHGVIK